MKLHSSSVDWESDVYAQGNQLNRWPYSNVVTAVMREYGNTDRTGMRALELGCGAGNNLWFLASAGFRVAGIDCSRTAINCARERLLGHGHEVDDLVIGDCARLPWPEGTFDLVVDRGAMTQNEHIRIGQIISEVNRVLRPNGVFHSFTLFGLEHPDRRYGQEISHHCYDFFTEGCFAKVGLSAFFTVDDLRHLFSPLRSVKITRHRGLDAEDRILTEEFSVRAVKGPHQV